MEPVVRTSRLAYSDTVMRSLGIEIARAGLTIFCKLDQDAAARAAGFRVHDPRHCSSSAIQRQAPN